jgi:hypothetical protein
MADKDLVAMIGPTIDPTSIVLDLQRLMAFGARAKASYMTKEGEVEKFTPSKFRVRGWQKYRDSSTKPLTQSLSKLIGKYRVERTSMLKDITGETSVVLPTVIEILETLKSDKDPDRVLVAPLGSPTPSPAKKKVATALSTSKVQAIDTETELQGKVPAILRPSMMTPRSHQDHFSAIDMQSVEEPAHGIAQTDMNNIADAVVMHVLEKLSRASIAPDGTVLCQIDAGIIGREVDTRPNTRITGTESVVNPRIVKRPPTVHQQYRFTDITKFAQFITAFNNYVTLQQMGYLLDKQFQLLYEVHGENAIDYYIEPSSGKQLEILRAQFKADNGYLRIWLVDAVLETEAVHIVQSNMNLSGIETYKLLMSTYNTDHTRQQRADQWMDKLHVRYNPRESLADYIRKMRTNMSAYNMEAIREKDQLDDYRKKRILLDRLRECDNLTIWHMAITADTIKDDRTFESLCDMLCSQAERMDGTAEQEARMRSKPAQRKFTTAVASYATKDSTRDDEDDHESWQEELIAALVKRGTENDSTFLDKTILDAMHPKAKRAFLMLRREVAQLKGSTTPKTDNMQARGDTDQKPPKQYGNTKTSTKPSPPVATANASIEVSSEDEDDAYDYDDDDEDRMGMLTQAHTHPYFGGVMMSMEGEQSTNTEVFTPLFDLQAHAVHRDDDNFAICDNGAQICILGGLSDVWHVETVQALRQVNIVGAVPSTMRRNNLLIVTAITKVYMGNGNPVLL